VPSIGTIGNYGEEMPNGVEIITWSDVFSDTSDDVTLFYLKDSYVELEPRLTFQFPVLADIVGEA
tara:strand:- start:10 stop:204 length:195 start_codon:yes stop_codon:yes gene_type:complete